MREANVREDDLADLRRQLADAEHALDAAERARDTSERAREAAEHELLDTRRERDDLRAIRDALIPPALPERPGLDLASAFVPAGGERVSGDFFVITEGPEDATILVVGDVMGHGVKAARQSAFVRTTIVATARFSHDPCQLLNWANVAFMERGQSDPTLITVACMSYVPAKRSLRWAYAGHPRALWLHDGSELLARQAVPPLGTTSTFECGPGATTLASGAGFLLYTDGLTEARGNGEQFGEEAVRTALAELEDPTAADVITRLQEQVTAFVRNEPLADDLCLLAARVR